MSPYSVVKKQPTWPNTRITIIGQPNVGKCPNVVS